MVAATPKLAETVELVFAGVDGDRRNRCAQLFAALAGVGEAAARQQDAEFLAAEAAEQVAGAQMHAARLHGLPQHVVARRVTVLVVDRLEVIQVAQDHAHFLLAACGWLRARAPPAR